MTFVIFLLGLIVGMHVRDIIHWAFKDGDGVTKKWPVGAATFFKDNSLDSRVQFIDPDSPERKFKDAETVDDILKI